MLLKCGLHRIIYLLPLTISGRLQKKFCLPAPFVPVAQHSVALYSGIWHTLSYELRRWLHLLIFRKLATKFLKRLLLRTVPSP